jgi:DNA-binding NarL/FixJ family response regulator
MGTSICRSTDGGGASGIRAGIQVEQDNFSISWLLVCEDAQVIGTLNRALESYDINTACSMNAMDAEEQLGARRFDAVIIDFSNREMGAQILQTLRKSKRNRNCTVLAIVDDPQTHRKAFQHGANFTIPQLQTVEQARRFLRSTYFLILRNKRASMRFALDESVSVYSRSEGKSTLCRIKNLSETGFKLSSNSSLREGELFQLEFQLPGGDALVNATANVVWVNGKNEIGARFTAGEDLRLKLIQDWINVKLLGRLQ